MKLDFFKQTRVLDGGMGQELLAKGMEPNGTLWSANALIQEKYHPLLLDTHLDFIKAGAEVIVTNTFTLRRKRLEDNNVGDKFEYLNTKACEIAIQKDFYNQAKIINPHIDFFYFDVLSSLKEVRLAVKAIESFNKPYLIGAHISDGTKLPSNDVISSLIDKIEHKNLLGLLLSCVSPETYEKNLNEIKSLDVPFGFKLNAFVTTTNTKESYMAAYKKSKGNPNEFLGQRKDLTPKKMAEFAKKFRDAGATILGGCCETRPEHIREMAKLK